MDYTPSLPKVTGTVDIPSKRAPRAAGGKRGPGKFYLHEGQSVAWARDVLGQVPADKALAIEFPDRRQLFLGQVLLHVLAGQGQLATKRAGLTLRVWRKQPAQQQLSLFGEVQQ